MTSEEAYKRIDAIIAKHEIDDDYVTITSILDYDALRMARKALEQEPCTDVISRQQAIDAIENYHIDTTDIDSDTEDSIKFGMATALNIIQQLPLVNPAEKMGQWITVDKGLMVTSYKCSECGRIERDDTGYDITKDYPYCHCGAKMQEVEE